MVTLITHHNYTLEVVDMIVCNYGNLQLWVVIIFYDHLLSSETRTDIYTMGTLSARITEIRCLEIMRLISSTM